MRLKLIGSHINKGLINLNEKGLLMNRKYMFIIICLLLCLSFQVAIAKTIYIEVNGNDETGDGSENKPYSSIQYGLNQARTNDVVQVGEGTFYENIVWPRVNGIKLIGKGESLTILDGSQKDRVIQLTSGVIDKTTEISGVTIRNGKGGIYCKYAGPTLSNLLITMNSTYSDGGGIYCYLSKINITNVSIKMNNSCRGGGIYCSYSDLKLENLSITKNKSENGGGIEVFNSNLKVSNVSFTDNFACISGGAIFCHGNSEKNQLLSDVVISNNRAYSKGGGIYCISYYLLNMSNVTIINNFAYKGGGISIDITQKSSNIIFDNINKCNIYLNNAVEGNDIYSNIKINLIVDIFTVKNPSNYHLSPIDNFTLDIVQGRLIQKNYDLYVSPDGNNENKGDSFQSPLKNIFYALSSIQPNENIKYNIFLNSGVYSKKTNGEVFPLKLIDYVNIEGQSEKDTILDGNKENMVICCKNISDVNLSNLTIVNGKGNHGGGIYCAYSRLNLSNIVITENCAIKGGGIYTTGSSVIFNEENRCSIYSNHAGVGNDIYSGSNIDLILNIFTVKNPTSFHIKPLPRNYNILKGLLPQKKFDLYVSPTGDNKNKGDTIDSPLKNIYYALSVIQPNENSKHTIYLNSGIYAPETNGEIFPLSMIDFINIEGQNKNNTILDGNNKDGIIHFENNNNITLTKLKIQNGKSLWGGGIYCFKSNFNWVHPV